MRPRLDALGNVAAEQRNSRALVAIGKIAVQRGLPLDAHAYPTIGIPNYEASAAVPLVEKAMVFAIARQESQFDPQAQSSVGARGLMQMMPATAQRTARRVSASFDPDRLTSDPAYNARLGQAHLGELMEDWRGSYILAFASYNAGGGNVKKWIDAYGDPRKGGRRPHRLGRAHPVHRDAQLRSAGDGEPAGLPQSPGRQERAAHRRRPSARGTLRTRGQAGLAALLGRDSPACPGSAVPESTETAAITAADPRHRRRDPVRAHQGQEHRHDRRLLHAPSAST